MPYPLATRDEPLRSQLVRHCDIVRRAAIFLAKEADLHPPESRPVAEQIALLRQQSAAMKQVICENLDRSSFIDPAPEDSLRLTAAFDASIESIQNCAQVLATHTSGQTVEIAAITCNLILRCVDHLHDCIKRRDADGGELSRHGKPAAAYGTIHTLQSEISRVLQRDLVRARDEEPDASQFLKTREIIESIEAAADRCRTMAGLLESMCV